MQLDGERALAPHMDARPGTVCHVHRHNAETHLMHAGHIADPDHVVAHDEGLPLLAEHDTQRGVQHRQPRVRVQVVGYPLKLRAPVPRRALGEVLADAGLLGCIVVVRWCKVRTVRGRVSACPRRFQPRIIMYAPAQAPSLNRSLIHARKTSTVSSLAPRIYGT